LHWVHVMQEWNWEGKIFIRKAKVT
jgi:hypothetical protein